MAPSDKRHLRPNARGQAGNNVLSTLSSQKTLENEPENDDERLPFHNLIVALGPSSIPYTVLQLLQSFGLDLKYLSYHHIDGLCTTDHRR